MLFIKYSGGFISVGIHSVTVLKMFKYTKYRPKGSIYHHEERHRRVEVAQARVHT